MDKVNNVEHIQVEKVISLEESDRRLWLEATSHSELLRLEGQAILSFTSSYIAKKYKLESKPELEYFLLHGSLIVSEISGPESSGSIGIVK